MLFAGRDRTLDALDETSVHRDEMIATKGISSPGSHVQDLTTP
jgi:hypothetical protein